MYTDDILYSFAKRINEDYEGDLTLYVKGRNFNNGEYISESKNYINITLSPSSGGLVDVVGSKTASKLLINIEMNFDTVKVFENKKRELEKVLKDGIEKIKLYSLDTAPATETNRSFILYPEDVSEPLPILMLVNQEVYLWRVAVTKFND